MAVSNREIQTNIIDQIGDLFAASTLNKSSSFADVQAAMKPLTAELYSTIRLSRYSNCIVDMLMAIKRFITREGDFAAIQSTVYEVAKRVNYYNWQMSNARSDWQSLTFKKEVQNA